MDVAVPRTFPLSPGGSAEGLALPNGTVVLDDLTAHHRFGLKGPGSAAWAERQGIGLPGVNRVGQIDGLRVLRLGTEDLLFTGAASTAVAAHWHADAGPRGYSSWREEGWAWMRLSGPCAQAVMARLCAVDLRPGHFSADELAQTRVAGIEAVVLRADADFELFFDIASTAHAVSSVIHVAERLAHADQPA